MHPLVWQLATWAAAAGHFGLHLTLYNRINALGIPRRVIKLIEKTLFVEMLITPIALGYGFGKPLLAMLIGQATTVTLPAGLWLYGVACLATWPIFGIPWLLWRPIFGFETAAAKRTAATIHVPTALGRSLALSAKCRWQSRLPMNQIFDLSIDRVELQVVGLPATLDGYRIAHLSDIHLTGDMHSDFAKFAVQTACEWRPDLFALTGDIIDKQPCIDWLFDIFSPAAAPDGCYFILGNHDTRIVDSRETRQAMDRAGWTDLGGRGLRTKLWDVPALLIGNEAPWFEPPRLNRDDRLNQDHRGDQDHREDQDHRGDRAAGVFRMAISHSPDQLSWARRHGVTLMLAGHTHGGQGRLPLAGPLLSPSLHGSRYASGDFYKPPTTMHVSRGLGGVHLVRFRCPPELSLLTLRRPS